MTIPGTAGPHLEDGALVQLLDGEADPAERDARQHHLAECEGCRARYSRLAHRSARLSMLLAGPDTEVARPRVPGHAPARVPARDLDRVPGSARDSGPIRAPVRSPWLRVAATVVLLLALGLTVSPARAWIVQGWQRVATVLAARDVAWDGPHGRETAESETGAAVGFRPAGSDVSIEVDHLQAAGELTLRVDAVEEVRVAAAGRTGDEGFLVLPSAVRIQNSPDSRAGYQVTVPGALERVRVRLAGCTVGTLRPGVVGAGTERAFALDRLPERCAADEPGP